jgi:hypothetical protein
MNKPIPLRPDYGAVRARAGQSLVRAATALLLSRANKTTLKEVVAKNWPSQKDLITRAASTPANSTTVGWAADLIGSTTADGVSVLSPASAYAAIFERGMRFTFDGSGNIIVPNIVAAASNADFVAEGAPIPVIQLDTSGHTIIQPKKFAVITTFTKEALSHSVPNVEVLVRTVLGESIALALDSKLLDATAGSTTRPAGLRNGIAAETASGATSPAEAMAEDIGTLVGAIAAVAGNSPILIIAAAPQAAALRMWNRTNINYDVVASSGLADGVVIALATNAFASAGDPAPRFELASETTLHFENTAPLDITTAAVAATVKALWQSDLIGLRTIFEVSWALRDAGGLSWVENVNW